MKSDSKTVFEEEEDDDEDEGPPPGFDSIVLNSQLGKMDVEDADEGADEGEDEDEGPPPGFSELYPPTPPTKQQQPENHSDTEAMRNQWISDIEMAREQSETKNEDDWHSSRLQSLSPEEPRPSMAASELVSDVQMENAQEEDDGPPPGWEWNPQQQPPPPPVPEPAPSSNIEMEREPNETKNEDDWHSSRLQSLSPEETRPSMASSELVSDVQMENVQEEDDGPPPGWEWNPPHQPPPPPVPEPAPSSNFQMRATEEDDDGPPPGWHSLPQQPPQAMPPSSFPHSEHPSDIDKENKRENKGEIESNQLRPESSHLPEHSSEPTLPPPLSSSVASSDIEVPTKQQSTKNEEKKLRTERGPMLSRIPSSALSNSSEVGQLVCGSCRQLLSYTRGAKWVQCSACQTVNLALEAHQVGQVKCGGCTVLLMYPYGAPSVKCSSCHFVTRISAHNRRPHLAAQQARRRSSRQAH